MKNENKYKIEKLNNIILENRIIIQDVEIQIEISNTLINECKKLINKYKNEINL